MQKIATLTGHTFRVLYLAVSTYHFLFLLRDHTLFYTQLIIYYLFAAITRWIDHSDRCWR